MPTGLPRGALKTYQGGTVSYVVGDSRAILRDAYHTFLKMPWSLAFVVIATGFFIANLAFAAVYLVVGGVEGSQGTFMDALSFSVQTMATIGYGVMHPTSAGANAVMIVESMVGIIVTALATGLVFSKFSRPTTRIAFSKFAVITQHEGNRTLIFRCGNRRGNVIVEATLHVATIMTTVTAEGEKFYKAHDLKLVRDRQVGMTRGWTVMHVIDTTSPFHGLDQAALAAAEVEVYVGLTGIDDITAQTVHTIHRYTDVQIRDRHRLIDTLSELEDGTMVIDLSKFDEVVPDTTPRVSVRG